MKEIYAALDLGSATVKLLIGEAVGTNVNILFSKKITSLGVRRGKITDMDAVVLDIQKLVDEATKTLGTPLNKVALCIPSTNVSLYRSEGMVKVESPEGVVATNDIVKALRQSTKFKKNQSEEIISVVPTQFNLDTKSMKELPVGMKSASLKVESLIIATSKKTLYDYITAVEKAGLGVLDICINAYTCAKEAFDVVYLEEGAILIDIGYKNSTIAFFEKGYLKYVAQANVGGYDLTKQLANSWQIPLDKAEVYKVKYGTCDTNVGEEDIIHTTISGKKEKHYTQKDLAKELVEGVKDMMSVIKEKTDIINDGRGYETVIVGGGGELPDIDKVASQVMGNAVRTYRPETIGARDMAYVSCLGMIYYMDERKEILGEIEPSLVLPDITSTMSFKLKGLTKNKGPQEKKKNKLSSIVDKLFVDDE